MKHFIVSIYETNRLVLFYYNCNRYPRVVRSILSTLYDEYVLYSVPLDLYKGDEQTSYEYYKEINNKIELESIYEILIINWEIYYAI